jgi:hypothetical protein
MIELSEEQKAAIERRYVLIFALCVAVAAAIPSLYGLSATPAGTRYLGFQFGTDDQLVYAAWMRQAMDGQFLMDNRFTTDPQPGLTIHLYFWALGQVARFTGIAFAMLLARIGFSALFVFLAYRLIRRVTSDVYTSKLAITLTVLAGGLGFLAWHNFGREIVRPEPLAKAISPLTGGWLPVDVWQPEGFVFPAMLTNSLFLVSLCLILWILLAFLDARESWRPVLGGALAMAVLMNIHSYDVLLITMVMVGFLTMQLARRDVTVMWIVRALVIGAGAILPAMWFLHVLRNDPVFQSRADTPTYSGTFRQMVLGYGVMVVLGLIALARMPMPEGDAGKRRWVGVAGLAALYFGLYAAAFQSDPGAYFMSLGPWLASFAVALVALAFLSTERPGLNLITAWAVVGLIAPYFPALFQRKLAMGLSIPWAILAALGLAALAARQERYSRNLTTVLAILVLAGSSLMWMRREITLIAEDVSNTTIHPVFLGKDVRNILAYLNGLPSGGRVVITAPPGQPTVVAVNGERVPDEYASPYMPDLNPILSGLAGVYSYAGHWSETPRPTERQQEIGAMYSSRTSDGVRSRLLEIIRPDYLVAPVPSSFPDLPLHDFSGLGEIVVDGTKFRLIKLSR